VSTGPDKRPSLLAPLADSYEATDADAARVLARIQATLEAPPSAASTRAIDRGLGGGKKTLFIGLSCLSMAIVGAIAVWMTRESPLAAHGNAVAATPSIVPTAPAANADAPPAAERPRASDGTALPPTVSVDALPSVVPAPAVGEPRRGAATAPATTERSPDTLEREARLLAEARRAVKAGERERALALLDEHARAFPNGWLASDRAAEHIVVLCSLGRQADAIEEARVFLEGRPKSPLTRRVETSCAGDVTRSTR